MSERHSVYWLFDVNRALLYIGESRNPLTRWKQHERDKPWWDEVTDFRIKWFDCFVDAAKAERLAILAENPRYNVERHDITWERPPRQSAWAPLPGELAQSLKVSGRRLARTSVMADRATVRRRRGELGGLVYAALALGCQPKRIYNAAGITYELMGAVRKEYMSRHPELPFPQARYSDGRLRSA